MVNRCLLLRASVYREQGLFGPAEAMLAEVEPRLVQALPRGHYAFASLALSRARLAQARRDCPRALAEVDRALSLLETNVAANQQGGFARPLALRYRADIEQQTEDSPTPSTTRSERSNCTNSNRNPAYHPRASDSPT